MLSLHCPNEGTASAQISDVDISSLAPKADPFFTGNITLDEADGAGLSEVLETDNKISENIYNRYKYIQTA